MLGSGSSWEKYRLQNVGAVGRKGIVRETLAVTAKSTVKW